MLTTRPPPRPATALKPVFSAQPPPPRTCTPRPRNLSYLTSIQTRAFSTSVRSGYLTAVPPNLLSSSLGYGRLRQDNHNLSQAHQHCLHYLMTFYRIIHRRSPSLFASRSAGHRNCPVHCYYKLEELQSLARFLASIQREFFQSRHSLAEEAEAMHTKHTRYRTVHQ